WLINRVERAPECVPKRHGSFAQLCLPKSVEERAERRGTRSFGVVWRSQTLEWLIGSAHSELRSYLLAERRVRGLSAALAVVAASPSRKTIWPPTMVAMTRPVKCRPSNGE